MCGVIIDVQPRSCATCDDGINEVFVAVRDLMFEPEVRGAVNRPETAVTTLCKPVTIFETAGDIFPVVEDCLCTSIEDVDWQC
jgi:hypothetical protein